MSDEPAPTPDRAAPWPYPAYADDRWLGGASGPDPTMVVLVAALRRLTPSAAGDEPALDDGVRREALTALAGLADLTERASWAMLALVGEARGAGAPWAEVGAALGVSRQAARQRFAATVDEAVRRAGQQS